jgi:Domain of unknown function (DUF4034)
MNRFLTLLFIVSALNLPVAAQIGISGTPGGPALCTEMNLKKNIPCPDSTLFDFEGVLVVQRLYNSSDFRGLDELFEKWSTGADRFPDGRWKLAMFEEGMDRQFEVWKTWADDRKKINAWQTKFPDSFAAKYVEALYWRAYAWSARGSGYASSVAPESWTLFKERLGYADKALESIQAQAAKYPAWYVAAINTKLELGDRAAATELFRQGVEKAPEYHSIYFAMGRNFEPKWGGTAESFDRFALEAMRLAKFEAEGMYLRLYWTVDARNGVPFESVTASIPDWKKLKTGIQLLSKKYPSSTHNMNHFASLACRAHDKPLYLELRSKLGGYANPSRFRSPTLEACDLRFGFSSRS